MSILKVAELVSVSASELASLMWMELVMFGLAIVVYLLFVRMRPLRGLSKANPRSPACTKSVAPLQAGPDPRATLGIWHRARLSGEPLGADIAVVVEAMHKLGSSVPDVIAELRRGVDENPKLLDNIRRLPSTLLRDNAVQLLDATLVLLAEMGCPVDVTAYAGLMAAQLRRRDFAGVNAVAARLPADVLTPRMLAMLAASAAHRDCLDEALGHLRQMPKQAEHTQSLLLPSAVVQILAVAAKKECLPAAVQELQRVHARLDPKYFDELLMAQARSQSPDTIRSLLGAGAAFAVPVVPNGHRALAYALARAADAPGLRKLMKELETESAGETLALALLDACRAVRDGDAALRVLEIHRAACTDSLSAKVLCAVCGTLIACDRKEAACDLYEREMAPKGVLPDASLTNALLKATVALGLTEMTQQLLDRASSQASTELQRHAGVIKAYARERNMRGAEGVYNRLRESEVVLTPLVYNCFLDACVQCGETSRAVDHFEEMKSLNVVDVVSFNTMIKVRLAEGLLDEVRALVKEMAGRGLQANKVTFNELLHDRVLANDRHGMWGVIDEMQRARVRANVVTCSILLKSLTVRDGPTDMRRIIVLIESMEESMDEVLFSSVVEACIRTRQLGLLSDVMRRFRTKGNGVSLSAPTYGSMIKAYGQARDVVRVRELWEEMENQGVKATSITLGCLTEALVINYCPDEAWELIHKQLEKEETRGCINTVIYSTVLKGFASSRRMDKVFDVYKEMRARSIPCNTVTYNTLLDACAKACTMSHAPQLLEDMRESCVEPDIITYSSLVKGYCADGDVDRAFRILEDMKKDNTFAPDEIMYNSILDGCAKQHRVDDAMRILEEMKSTGVSLSNYTLSILVKLLGHARRLNQAFQMVEDLSSQNGFRPNIQVYTCLVQACVLNRRLDKALQLHQTMLTDTDCKVDDKFYATLARGCLQMRQPLKAVEVIQVAYQLPGHTLASPSRTRHSPVGVESRTLDEIASKLRCGSPEEQQALASLASDLQKLRNVRLGDGSSAARPDARRPRGSTRRV